MKEEYTSEMIKDVLEDLVTVVTSATITARMCGGNLSEQCTWSILHDLADVRTRALLILTRMNGWEYTAFDKMLMEEVEKHIEFRVHEDDET